MGIKEVTTVLEIVNARHGPEANLGEGWPGTEWHDHLVDPASLVWYLDYERLPHPPGEPGQRDLEALRELADVGRAIAREDPSSVAARLEPVLARYTFRLAPDGSLVPTADGWQAFAANAALGLVELAAQRERLAFCANPACDWLFIDESRNQSRRNPNRHSRRRGIRPSY